MCIARYFSCLYLFLILTASCKFEKKVDASGSSKSTNRISEKMNLIGEKEGQDYEADSSFFLSRTTQFEEEVKNVFRSYLDTATLYRLIPEKKVSDTLWENVKRYYQLNEYRLKWLHYYGLNHLSDSLQRLISDAHLEGLNPGDYQMDKLYELEKEVFSITDPSAKVPRLIQLDLYHTATFFSYISDIANGRINPNDLDGIWRSYPKNVNYAEIVKDVLDKEDFQSFIKYVRPDNVQYDHLIEELRRYKEIAENGGWPKVPENISLTMNDSSELAGVLKERLYIEGFYSQDPASEATRNVFDDKLEKALKEFQEVHGLEPDGVPGPRTLFYLNQDPEFKIAKIRINLERLRWHSADQGDTYVLVNVPEFALRVYDGGELQLEMKVIVGKEYNSTPIFRDTITYLVLSPDWTVPLSIARSKILGMLRDDPQKVINQNFIIYEGWSHDSQPIDPHSIEWEEIEPHEFNYRVVQMPGPNNALGTVKFMFPNPMRIYLHDTPQGYLFNRKERMFSHGCVRVEKPLELAEYLLRENEGWDLDKIRRNLRRPEPLNLPLAKPMPIQLVYKTAWVDENGRVNFRDDIYGHDAAQLRVFRGS